MKQKNWQLKLNEYYFIFRCTTVADIVQRYAVYMT